VSVICVALDEIGEACFAKARSTGRFFLYFSHPFPYSATSLALSLQ